MLIKLMNQRLVLDITIYFNGSYHLAQFLHQVFFPGICSWLKWYNFSVFKNLDLCLAKIIVTITKENAKS